MNAITVTRSFSEVTKDDLRECEPTHEELVGADDPYVGPTTVRGDLTSRARSLWAPRGASHRYMRSSDLVHHLRRIRETHALRASDVT